MYTLTLVNVRSVHHFSPLQDGSYSIASAVVSDTGTYMCVVETILDEATHNVQIVNASANLVVQGKIFTYVGHLFDSITHQA